MQLPEASSRYFVCTIHFSCNLYSSQYRKESRDRYPRMKILILPEITWTVISSKNSAWRHVRILANNSPTSISGSGIDIHSIHSFHDRVSPSTEWYYERVSNFGPTTHSNDNSEISVNSEKKSTSSTVSISSWKYRLVWTIKIRSHLYPVLSQISREKKRQYQDLSDTKIYTSYVRCLSRQTLSDRF